MIKFVFRWITASTALACMSLFFSNPAQAQDGHAIGCPDAGTEITWEIVSDEGVRDEANKRQLAANIKGVADSASYVFKGGEGILCSYTATSKFGHRDETRFYMFCANTAEVDCGGHKQLADLWPMKVGNRASYTFQKHMNNGGVADFIASYKVETFEDIQTKAGTFKAYRIKENIDTIAGAFHTAFYFWYAPDVKFVIKRLQGKIDQNEAQMHSGAEATGIKSPSK